MTRRQVLGILGGGAAAVVTAPYGYMELTDRHPYRIPVELYRTLMGRRDIPSEHVNDFLGEYLMPEHAAVRETAADTHILRGYTDREPYRLSIPGWFDEETDLEQYHSLERWVKPPQYLERRKGDCEDHAFATGSLLLSPELGYPVRIVFGSFDEMMDGDFIRDMADTLAEPDDDVGLRALKQVLDEVEGHVLVETRIGGEVYVNDVGSQERLYAWDEYADVFSGWTPLLMYGQDPDGDTITLQVYDPDWVPDKDGED